MFSVEEIVVEEGIVELVMWDFKFVCNFEVVSECGN